MTSKHSLRSQGRHAGYTRCSKTFLTCGCGQVTQQDPGLYRISQRLARHLDMTQSVALEGRGVRAGAVGLDEDETLSEEA
ncbi:hypothetical protein E2C01_007944 [Portunus trituberculatus]|uniref:Uncharacterized protein n=1 Tax=Portunus trituberculatus TaxID=210409 RepID=A0A5B7D1S4_PORTR|nr:hypothetical protein [Portunus trituberculatus]